MVTDHAAALRAVHSLFDEHRDRWNGGLRRGGDGRQLGDWLAMEDLRELHDEIATDFRRERSRHGGSA